MYKQYKGLSTNKWKASNELCNKQILISHHTAFISVIAGLDPQSPRHYARQPSVRVSQTLRSYLRHMITAAK